MKRIISAKVLGLFILCSCATSPVGRKQIILLPDDQMDSMGIQAFDEMKKKTPMERDLSWNSYVQCVATPLTLAANSELSVEKWEIVVFKDDSANAFALPGGKIGVHTGLLKVAKNDAQVAAVIGHEVGHVIARHGNERVSEGFIAQGGLVTAQVLTQDSRNKNLLLGLIGLGAQYGFLLPHSRIQESEADVIGLSLMARAGFDPSQSIELWKNMESAGGAAPPEFLSTHPANSTRIQNLTNHLPDVADDFKNARERKKNPQCIRP